MQFGSPGLYSLSVQIAPALLPCLEHLSLMDHNDLFSARTTRGYETPTLKVRYINPNLLQTRCLSAEVLIRDVSFQENILTVREELAVTTL